MSRVSVTDLRANLREWLARVEAGEVVEIARDDKVIACIVDPTELRRRGRRSEVFAQAEELQQKMDGAHGKPLPPAGSISTKRADELIRQIRAERDRYR